MPISPTKHKRELSGSASPRDRRLGKWTALLAGCLLHAGRPDGALREARLAYLRDPMSTLPYSSRRLRPPGLAMSKAAAVPHVGATSSAFDMTSNDYETWRGSRPLRPFPCRL